MKSFSSLKNSIENSTAKFKHFYYVDIKYDYYVVKYNDNRKFTYLII